MAYEEKRFDFIVSLTAKDRVLTSSGIVPYAPTVSSLNDLLREVCDVTGFPELFQGGAVSDQVKAVNENILSEFNGLLLVDNLETVDDPRIIEFLENLPLPSRAVVTSRKARVRVAALPIEVGPFEEEEAVDFFSDCARALGKHDMADLSVAQKVKIVNSCDRIPLVIEWFVGRSRSAGAALAECGTLASQGKQGEELLEFSFRRIYGELSEGQQMILKVLSVIGGKLPVEAIAAGAGLAVHEVADDLEEMKDCSLVERQYDVNYRDVVHSLLPVTSTFVYRELKKIQGAEAAVRRRLNDWYQAKEIVDLAQRALVQKVRRGERNPELALVEVARNFVQGGDEDNAEHYYRLALERNPTSWDIHREFAEFYRHRKREVAMALQHYRLAAEYVPRQGPERAKVFREYGMVLRDSGEAHAHRDAAEHFETALKANPQDVICRHALGDCHVKVGAYQRALEVLRPLETCERRETRLKTYPLLEQCYENLGDMLGLERLLERMRADRAWTP